jgi:hypothetical protein
MIQSKGLYPRSAVCTAKSTKAAPTRNQLFCDTLKGMAENDITTSITFKIGLMITEEICV